MLVTAWPKKVEALLLYFSIIPSRQLLRAEPPTSESDWLISVCMLHHPSSSRSCIWLVITYSYKTCLVEDSRMHQTIGQFKFSFIYAQQYLLPLCLCSLHLGLLGRDKESCSLYAVEKTIRKAGNLVIRYSLLEYIDFYKLPIFDQSLYSNNWPFNSELIHCVMYCK